MSEPARPIIAATAATLLHLMLLAWLLPGFDLWRASDGAAGRAVSVSGEAEFDLPFVPVTLPSGALELVWSLGSIQQAAPQPTPRFQRPRGMRPGHLALSQMARKLEDDGAGVELDDDHVGGIDGAPGIGGRGLETAPPQPGGCAHDPGGNPRRGRRLDLPPA